MHALHRTVAAVAFAGTVLAQAGIARASDTVLRDPLAPGSTLHVRTISGFARVSRASGDATVRAHAHASDGLPIDMHVAQTRGDGSWTVCEVPLAQKSCDEHMSIDTHGEHASVDLTITVPAGVKLDITAVSGDVSVTGATSTVAVKNVSGDARVATTGEASIETVSGSIVCRSGSIGYAKSVSGDIDVRAASIANASFDDVSGDVKLAFPKSANVRVNAKTISGDVNGSGLAFSGADQYVGHDEHATLGRGDNKIDIHTVSGSISVSTY